MTFNGINLHPAHPERRREKRSSEVENCLSGWKHISTSLDVPFVFDLSVEVYPERLQGSRRAQGERFNLNSLRCSEGGAGSGGGLCLAIVTIPT